MQSHTSPVTEVHCKPSSPAAYSPQITVLIPNWNGVGWLGACLQALVMQDLAEFRTIIIDNGSEDGSVAFVKQYYPRVEVIELGDNTGFANAVNIGFERCESPYIVLLNSDTQAQPNWLRSLLEAIEKAPPDVAAIGSQLLRMDDPSRIDDAGDELSWFGSATKRGYDESALDYQEETEIFSPSAAACLFRRSFLLEVGGFDTRFFAYLEDVDLGVRGRLLGYRYLYLPKARVLHKGHGAALAHDRYVEMMTRNRLLLFTKNIPGVLLRRHAMKLLYGQLYFLIAYARPWSSIKGYLSFLIQLPWVLPDRKRLLRKSVLTVDQINGLLHEHVIYPSLRNMISSWLSKNVGW